MPFFSADILWIGLAFLISLTIHEWAHAYAATVLGDFTAKRMGRLSLNPLRHLDPIGTLMIFLIGIGWAKPVPVQKTHLRNPERDMAVVAFAGPLSNLLLVVISGGIMSLISMGGLSEPLLRWGAEFCSTLITVNLVLMVFNLIPLYPLDGHHIFRYFMPHVWKRELGRLNQEHGALPLLALLGVEMLLPIPGIIAFVMGIVGYLHAIVMIAVVGV